MVIVVIVGSLIRRLAWVGALGRFFWSIRIFVEDKMRGSRERRGGSVFWIFEVM